MGLCSGKRQGKILLLPLVPLWLVLAVLLTIRWISPRLDNAESCKCPLVKEGFFRRCVCLHGECYSLDKPLVERSRYRLFHDPAEFNENLWSAIGYRPGDLVGRGGFGEVWLATKVCESKDELYVIKKVNAENREEWEREAHFGEVLGGVPHIARFVSAADQDGFLWLVFAYEGKSLNSLMFEQHSAGMTRKSSWWLQTKSSDNFRGVMQQLFDALQELHKRGIIHRDIKPENVLINAQGYLNIIDFGSAVDTSSVSRFYNLKPVSSEQETLRYSPPEVWFTSSRTGLTTAFDMWSAGILWLELRSIDLKLMRPTPKEQAQVLRKVPNHLKTKALKLQGLRNVCVEFLEHEPELDAKWFQPVVCDGESLKARIQAHDDEMTTSPTDYEITFVRRTFAYDPQSRLTALEATELWSGAVQ